MSRKRLSLADIPSLCRGDKLKVEESTRRYRDIGFGEERICLFISKCGTTGELIEVASSQTGRMTEMYYWRFSKHGDDWWDIWGAGGVD